MTLTDRLSASFLAALALILVGFATALDVMATIHLNRAVDDRLTATLATLSAMAEDEPDGFDWEHDDKRSYPGNDSSIDQVRWIVFDENEVEVDRSKNLANADRIESPGRRLLDGRGIPWRVVRLRLISDHPRVSDAGTTDRHHALTLQVGLRLDPLEGTLQTLTIALVVLTTSLWGLTALVGRWICRRALAPLTRMAVTARELGTDEPSRRLPVCASGDELEALARAFNGLLDRWHETLDRQSRFAGDASHQLRTPLAVILGQIDVVLRRDRSAEEYRRTLTRVRDQSERLGKIAEALLFLARADTEAALPSREEIDLVEWVDQQVRLRREAGSGTNLSWCRPLTPVVVKVHPELLTEVVGNLIDNARDHSPPGSPIRIDLEVRSEEVSLVIEDQGRGIAPTDLDRIFEPFYRTDDSRKFSPGGIGLGLAIARRITHAMGGQIEVRSEIGVGSRFSIRFGLHR